MCEINVVECRDLKKVAVLLSVYQKDNAMYLKSSLDSILDQTYSDIFIFIGVDGPLEEALEKCLSQYSSKSNIRIYNYEKNRGLAAVLNDLLRVSLDEEFEYIVRMDADDISMVTRIEKQVAFMELSPEIDCLGTWAIEIDAEGNEYFRKNMPVTHKECLELFKKRDCVIHPTVMFRRSYIEKAGFYPEDTYFGEDTMMWAQGFIRGCHFANIPEYLLKFRLDENFFQRRRGWKHAKSILNLRRRVNRMLDFGFKEDCYAVFYAIIKMMPTRILSIIYQKMR